MKFCQNCGKEIMDEAVICVNCGCATSQNNAITPAADDNGSTGWAVLGFFFPLIGLILYLVWKNTKPNNAKKAGKGALIGFIVSVVFWIIYIIAVASMVGSYYY